MIKSASSISLDLFPNPILRAKAVDPPRVPIPVFSNVTNIAGKRIRALAAAIHKSKITTFTKGINFSKNLDLVISSP